MGIHERKIKEKEKRRNTIIKAAKKCFFRVGFQNSSMLMVAEEAQLSKGTLYLYFRSKDDLYVTLLVDGLRILEKMFSKVEAPDKSTEDTLIDYSLVYYKFMIEYPELFKIMVDINTGEMVNLNNVNPVTLSLIREYEERIFLNRIKIFQKGIQQGTFSENTNSCYSTTMLWTNITGAIILAQKQSKSKIFENINIIEFLKDITKLFIIAHSNSEEKIKKYREEILSNAFNQMPTKLHLAKQQ